MFPGGANCKLQQQIPKFQVTKHSFLGYRTKQEKAKNHRVQTTALNWLWFKVNINHIKMTPAFSKYGVAFHCSLHQGAQHDTSMGQEESHSSRYSKRIESALLHFAPGKIWEEKRQ
eukprot:gb/GECG01003257.1/.p1 GENE.gb/GECG01003257.1/~~gb/GECG01003257.1/.p1  ORF type:complete len:116 (+),score=9.88 gb/GECG01003257.1/:1-348(+)